MGTSICSNDVWQTCETSFEVRTLKAILYIMMLIGPFHRGKRYNLPLPWFLSSRILRECVLRKPYLLLVNFFKKIKSDGNFSKPVKSQLLNRYSFGFKFAPRPVQLFSIFSIEPKHKWYYCTIMLQSLETVQSLALLKAFCYL